MFGERSSGPDPGASQQPPPDPGRSRREEKMPATEPDVKEEPVTDPGTAKYTEQQERDTKTTRVAPKIHGLGELPKDFNDIDTSFLAYVKLKVTDPTHWNKLGTCAERISTDYSVWEMIADVNGSEGFSPDKAATGTVSNSLYLQVTSGMTIPTVFEIGKDPFISSDAPLNSEEYQKRILLFLWANTKMLMDSEEKINQEAAIFLAHIRLHFVLAGGTAMELSNRSLYVDEYTISSATFAQVQLTDISMTRHTTEFIAGHWMVFVALCRHMFVTRGHHWKDTYENQITKMWTSCNIEVPTTIRMPLWQHIIRSALHCFGIRSLQLLVMEAYDQGKLPGAMVKRIGAASAGTAPWRTAWAGILLMQQTIWYDTFAVHFDGVIKELEGINDFLVSAGVRCHVNAKLFNFSWTTMHISDNCVKILAPYIMGFADSLDEKDPFRGQKTLDKYANASSSIRVAFSQLLNNVRKLDKAMENVPSYFAAAPATRRIAE